MSLKRVTHFDVLFNSISMFTFSQITVTIQKASKQIKEGKYAEEGNYVLGYTTVSFIL